MTSNQPPVREPRVSALVVTYNSSDDIAGCLNSISSSVSRTPLEVLVADNHSTDDTTDVVRRAMPGATLVQNDTNLGFAAAVNQLASRSTGDYLLLLNPDSRLHPGTIEALLAAAERHPRAGIIGGRCLDQNGHLDPGSCWGHRTLWSELCFATGLSALFRGSRLFDPRSLGSWRRDTERTVGVVTGCLALIERTAWQTLDGFDETFWLYGEDVDLSERAWALGYRPMITPAAVITHEFGTSSPNEEWRVARTLQGTVTVLNRRHGRSRAALGVALLKAGVRLRGSRLLSRLPGRQQDAAVWRAVWASRAQWQAGFSAANTP